MQSYFVVAQILPHITSNLDRDRPSDIANALICAAILILLKQKQIRIIVHGILLRNKRNSLRRQKLLETNNMQKEKCSQIPNFAHLQPKSDWVKTNTELEMTYFILQKKDIRNLRAPSAKSWKKLQIVIMSRVQHPRKLPINLWTQIFLLTKAPKSNTSYTSSALHYKRALLKNVVTPTKNNKYQILGATAITYNDGTIRPTLSRVAICDKYNRGNKVITMSQPKIITVNETKTNCITIKKI